MRRFYLLLILPFVFSSCNKGGETAALRFHDDGRAKPIVAVVPVFDHSAASVPWSLAHEFTGAIEKRLSKRSNIFLVPDEKVASVTSFLDENCHPFGANLEWVTRAFRSNEFVVFMELLQHQMTPHEKKTRPDEEEAFNYSLDMKMRLRVIDLRGPEPQVILQELVEQSHRIPKMLANIDYAKNGFGKMSFSVTPMGLMHTQFTRQISKRLEDYILLAKSQ